MALTSLQAETIPANPALQDYAILAAYERREAAYRRYNTLPFHDDPSGDGHSEDEAACWAIIDETEEFIRTSVATTPKGAACQLWVALYHSVGGGSDDRAMLRRDLAFLEERGDALDWNVRLAIAALRSLEEMGA